MANEGVNQNRRRFLTASTAVVGGVGAVFAAVPFISSWKPSARAEVAGAPVTEDISKLAPGARLVTSWRGQPVWIIHRTPEQLAALASLDDKLRDPSSDVIDQQPAYAKNPHRSIKPEIAVMIGTCTHLGCSPLYAPELVAQPYDAEWKGGFFCPCHGSKFDMAGRVFQGVPAPTNLKVPPHRFLEDGRVQVGVDSEGAA